MMRRVARMIRLLTRFTSMRAKILSWIDLYGNSAIHERQIENEDTTKNTSIIISVNLAPNSCFFNCSSSWVEPWGGPYIF